MAGRGKGRARKARAVFVAANDIGATNERLAKDDWEWVNPAEIDSAEQPIGRVRRVVRTTLVDRLYQRDKLEWRQWYAVEMWRTWIERAIGNPRVSGLYDVPPSGGGSPSLLPLNEGAERSRQFLAAAREALPERHIAMIQAAAENTLILPGGRAHERTLDALSDALDILANWLGLSGGKKSLRALDSSGKLVHARN